ncbi:MAG: T9SS type A sorting domain-containing protein [Bacteroidota bacterium]|nr:T9SS type A sorting domain-containing protein [Bacteroidota bacterium]
MKKILLGFAYFLVSIFSIQAQTLYGTTFNGGNNGGGTINKFIPATNNLIVPKSFEDIASNPQFTNFIQASDGKLYGMTQQGGSSNMGVIFSFDPTSSTYTKVKDFDNTNGAYPIGSLIQASDGKLYGMARDGGSSDMGVIFSFDPSSSIYTKLKDFDNTTGAYPEGSLIQASDGKLYGMTIQGGNIGVGVIFSFNPSNSTYIKLEDFAYANGAYPHGSLMQASDGELYGMAQSGGSGNYGVIFSYDPRSSTYAKLKDFDSTNGANPYGSLMQANDGKLYGMTSIGGGNGIGVIFSFNPASSTYTKLKDFDYPDGANPYGTLIQANDGKLYGMTQQGGSSSKGVIFSYNLSHSTYTKLEDFNKANGANPYSSLMQAIDGKLYGMTYAGGSSDHGLIFSYAPSSSTYAKLKDFGTNESGSNSSSSLVHANDGKLYGMSTSGGSHGYGVIFSFDPSTSTYTKLKDFDYPDGSNPYGSLIQATNGKLYGMTHSGGSDNYGVILSYDPRSSTYAKLKDFDSITGANPYGSLMQAIDGKLYGMTYAGGSSDYGVIFSFDPSSSIYTKLKDFEGPPPDVPFELPEGANPYGSLVQASDGKLYGMTSKGGVLRGAIGVIFSFDPSSSTYAVLKGFSGLDNFVIDGGGPEGSLMQARDGKLYGMTYSGGNNGDGVIFSFNPSGSIYTKLYDFDNINGSYPAGNLMQEGDGKLYGMTYQGGSRNAGVIFSFDPLSSTYIKLKDYNGANGANPYLGSAFIEVAEGGPLPLTLLDFTGKNNGTGNQLYWKVENEQNLNYYELQRSIDGQNFNKISQIKATVNNNYTYNDNVAFDISSVYYYRLQSVDNDGNFKYSVVIKIRTGLNGKFATVNPNPFQNKLVVNIESPVQDKAIFIITDAIGRQLYKGNKLLLPGTNVVEINEAVRLSKGTYLLTVVGSQQTQSIKVVKGN